MNETTAWLLRTAADLLDVPVDALDPTRPLVEYGLSSRTAVTFTGLIGERFPLAVTPTLLWEHPTITDLAAHLPFAADRPIDPERTPARHPLLDLIAESS